MREIGLRPGFQSWTARTRKIYFVGGRFLGIDTKQVRFPTAEVMGDIFSFALNTDRPVPEVIAEKYKRFQPLTNQIGLSRGNTRRGSGCECDGFR